MKKFITIVLLFISGMLYGQIGDYVFTKGIFMQEDSLDGELKEVCRLDSVLDVNIVLRKNLLVVKYYEFGTSLFAGGFELDIDDSWTAEFGDKYVAYSQTINNDLFINSTNTSP